MYKILFVLWMAFGLGAEEVKESPRPASLPKDAEEVRIGVWQYKDAHGETWLYRRTPFGVAKYKPEGPAENGDSEAALLRAFDDGDNVRFERKTPFGVSKWTRKKSELAGGELATWKRASADSQESTNSKPAASTQTKGKKE